MCAAFFVACTAMIWAAVVQYYIYQTNPCGNYVGSCEIDGETQVSTLNVWIQTGAYVLVGLSEIFGSVTGLEYAYTKAPANMSSASRIAVSHALMIIQVYTTSPLPCQQLSVRLS